MNKKIILHISIQALLVGLFANISFAQIYYVSPSGNDTGDGSISSPFKTITKAATVLNSGDTVLVDGGTYSEKNIIPATSGTENAMIVFKPKPGTGVVTIKHPAAGLVDNIPLFNLSNKSYIWIEGFQFKDFEYGKATIFITNGQGNVVLNNRFENLGNSQVTSWDGNSVVWVYKSFGNIIRNNYFSNITGDGISINGQTAVNNLVCDNTFHTFKGKLRDWGGTYLFSRAIDVQDMSKGNNVIAFNYATGVVNHIWLDRDGSHNVMLRNVAHHSAGLVFNESRCAFNIIQENIGYNLTGAAFQTARYETTGWTFDARWVNNVAYNNRIGFYIDMSEREEFRNNISFNNTDYNLVFTNKAFENGPYVFRNNGWYSTNKTSSILLKNNAVSVSNFQSAVGETNGLSTNPLFVNIGAGSEDFSLQQSSYARNAGDRGVDMGAYAVYEKTNVGWDPNLQISNTQVYFDAIISSVARGGQIQLGLRLNAAVAEQVSVDVVPVAGDAIAGKDFQLESQTVAFEPGETRKSVTITIEGESDNDQLVAFRLTNSINAQAGVRNLRLLKINRTLKLTANAGLDLVSKMIDNSGSAIVTLDGSKSNDPDGTITAYSWSIGGREVATGVNPSINLTPGVHKISLTVIDNDGNTDTDEVMATVMIDSDIWLEAECGRVGSFWDIKTDNNPSNGQYSTIQQGNNSTSTAPTNANGQISYTFNVKTSGTYTLWARVICPDPNSDSFWLKMDNGSFTSWNDLANAMSWTWVRQAITYNLSSGSHTLTLAFREDGAKIDKLLLTNSSVAPSGEGSAASNCGITSISPGKVKNINIYPNPVGEVLSVTLHEVPSIISVYNTKGQRLFHMETMTTDYQLDMANYLPGVYMIKITNPDQIMVKKIIKK